MVIAPTDRIARLLDRDERILDVLVSISPEFERLRNPRMRKVMGRLLTVELAAEMAGLRVDQMIRRLRAGTRSTPPRTRDTPVSPADEPSSAPAPLAAVGPERIVDLDVRDDLRNGREPFSRIMEAKAALAPGHVLRLRATFEPVPLYAVMEKQGFTHRTERLADDDWRVWFQRKPENDAASSAGGGGREGDPDARRQRVGPDGTDGAGAGIDPDRTAPVAGPAVNGPATGDRADGAAARTEARTGADGRADGRRDPGSSDDPTGAAADPPAAARIAADDVMEVGPGSDGIVVLDVRGLEPPEPMVRTLAALETLPRGATLLQINVRVPEFLLPRLEPLGFEYEIRPQDDDLVRTFIRHADHD